MKSIKLSYVFVKIYLAHLLIGLILMGSNWYLNPTTDQEISMNLTSEVLLWIAIFLYLFPLFSLYETKVKENYAKKKFQEIIGQATTEIITKSELEERWAKTGTCDCDRCKQIREKIEAENKAASESKN